MMTAQITSSQMERYRQSAREREESLRAQLENRKQRAWQLAREAAQILKDEFGASRVVVFGSLTHLELFHSRSDIDLAAVGIHSYFRAVSRLMDLDPGFQFDLVPLEDVSSGFQTTIEQDGIDL